MSSPESKPRPLLQPRSQSSFPARDDIVPDSDPEGSEYPEEWGGIDYEMGNESSSPGDDNEDAPLVDKGKAKKVDKGKATHLDSDNDPRPQDCLEYDSDNWPILPDNYDFNEPRHYASRTASGAGPSRSRVDDIKDEDDVDQDIHNAERQEDDEQLSDGGDGTQATPSNLTNGQRKALRGVISTMNELLSATQLSWCLL